MRKFSELLLQIPSMNDMEAYFQFMGVLKPWVKQELKRCNARGLSMAMSMAETLVEYKPTTKAKPNYRPRDKVVGGGDCNKFHRPRGNKPPTASPKARVKPIGEQKKGYTFKCFLSDGDCQTQGKLAALVKAREEEQEERWLGLL